MPEFSNVRKLTIWKADGDTDVFIGTSHMLEQDLQDRLSAPVLKYEWGQPTVRELFVTLGRALRRVAFP